MYEKIEKLLKKKGITAYRMCKDIGLSPTVISDLKSGRSTPKIDKLLKIAEYFGVDVSVLIKK